MRVRAVSVRPSIAVAVGLLAFCAACAIALLCAPSASAHVPWVEPGTGSGLYALGRIDASKAVYGALTPSQRDVYTLTVSEPSTTTIELLVPVRPALRSFTPTVRITGPGGVVQTSRVNMDRPRFYEPFSIASFWEVAAVEATFAPGATYRLEVYDVVGAPGPYVVAFGGPEAFSSVDVAETFAALPRIWLGTWGGEPVRPSAVAILIISGIVTLAMLAWLAWWLVRDRRRKASAA